MKKIFILTGEASGDKLASTVVSKLKQKNLEIEYLSVGGSNLASLGIKSIFDLNEITYIGFTSVLLNILKIKKKINQTVNEILKFKPDILFSVDSPDFTLRVAEKVKKLNNEIKTVHYVAPQVWVWREGRVKKFKKFLDHILLLFDFERKYFDKDNIPNTFVGHPLLEKETKNKTDISNIISDDKKIISLFAGSRSSEINLLLPILINFINIMNKNYNNYLFVFHTTEESKKLINEKINSSNLQNVEVCKDEPIQIGVLPINDPSITYFWSPSFGLNNVAIANPIATINTSTQYQLIITDGLCSDTIYQLVNVDSIDINSSEDTTFCKDPILLSANTSGTVNSIIWSTDNNFSDTISLSSFYTANIPGTYYILVRNNNCSETDSVNVTNDNINIEISGITEICKGDSVFIKVDDLSSLDPIVSYDWESEYELFFSSDSSNFISYPESSTWYKVIATNTLGCFVSDSIFVEVHNYPISDSVWASDTSIFLGESTQLNVSTSDNVLWNTYENSNSIIISPEHSSLYHVVIYNEFCQIEDSIFIEVKDVFCDKDRILIPSAFSPNEDDKNDLYKIVDKDGIIREFKLEIFNRFGQKVYSSENINNGWDGYFQGVLLSSQVFDYYLEIKCVGEKYLFEKGNITLIR